MSNVTLKVAMAITGTVFIAFVFAHMIGNLKVYAGADDFDHYAAFLRELLVPFVPREWMLWGLRIVLAVCLVAHVGSAGVLTARARRAGGSRTTRGHQVPWWRSFTSRTMAVSGIVVFAFVAFHLADLTFGVTGADFRHPSTIDGERHYHAYENLVASFQRPLVAAFYIVAMAVLAAHVVHGAWSVIHDLGVTGARTRRALWTLGTVLATVIMLGNISIPVAVLIGVVE